MNIEDDARPRLIFSFKYLSREELASSGSGSNHGWAKRTVNSIAASIIKFSFSYKHVEISVPVAVLRKTRFASLLDAHKKNTNFNISRYFTLAVVAPDPNTSRGGGGVTFQPRAFSTEGYLHLAVPRSMEEVEKFVQFAQNQLYYNSEYRQYPTDVYLWPGFEARKGWYCVSLTTAAGQAANLFCGIPQTEMSTGFMMYLCQQKYNATAEQSHKEEMELVIPDSDDALVYYT